jgi:hypothetical protein
VPQQIDEQIEDLGLRRDRRVPAADPLPGGIDEDFGYLVFHSAGSGISPQIIIKLLPKN